MFPLCSVAAEWALRLSDWRCNAPQQEYLMHFYDACHKVIKSATVGAAVEVGMGIGLQLVFVCEDWCSSSINWLGGRLVSSNSLWVRCTFGALAQWVKLSWVQFRNFSFRFSCMKNYRMSLANSMRRDDESGLKQTVEESILFFNWWQIYCCYCDEKCWRHFRLHKIDKFLIVFTGSKWESRSQLLYFILVIKLHWKNVYLSVLNYICFHNL